MSSTAVANALADAVVWQLQQAVLGVEFEVERQDIPVLDRLKLATPLVVVTLGERSSERVTRGGTLQVQQQVQVGVALSAGSSRKPPEDFTRLFEAIEEHMANTPLERADGVKPTSWTATPLFGQTVAKTKRVFLGVVSPTYVVMVEGQRR